jgi:hypothetical protein
MKSYLKNLGLRWGIRSIYRLWLILFIFAISGTTTLFIKEPVYYLFNMSEHTPGWIKAMVYIAAILPSYFFILLFYATLFGQQVFFIDFIKKIFLKRRSVNGFKKPCNN